MPIRGEEIRIDLMCGPDGCWVGISLSADALWRLGLHPAQPTSKIVGPSPPAWWRFAADWNA
ncbi:hypothetical protein JOF56_010472 [Kibdelosporangium banguiense]|uniref:Uncharacterized protein n=1 Tax=Kibdelosporangium banguiense TaxID=1365924 RepID=A0ABS4U0B6_9PSEU|nr:hypothetical protein [Kibdelosporangium banguiense]MBP2330087.1 hypothetical protein [Kibdelosporangium banguiense]